uniref:Uncharacterized protein n=1 Tax=Hemiselmis andersenii TaxID=464988 RepID=A0A6T8HP08_HEMAN|mmetsp:Transcript_52786/g.127856  ORF Transcript_52786/g.127856 Transcript_52786/m.127856 type:complete len:471 (-) Transcript_52786:192-1604(-)
MQLWPWLQLVVAAAVAATQPSRHSAVALFPSAAGFGRAVSAVDGGWARSSASSCCLELRGGGNTLGVDGEAITEEQAGEELIKAATSGDVHGLEPAGIEYLIQAGAPVNYQDMWRRTPLHYAAREGHVTAVVRLVELGADQAAEDFLARTPLHMAARKGHVAAMEALAKLGSDLNHPDKNPWPNNGGRTPLHWACYKGHADVAAKLCQLGADMEVADLMKRTPLHWAARRGNADCVQVLLFMGANVHAVDCKALKPLNLANSKESTPETQALLHAATIRGNLPNALPEFAVRPIPQPVPRSAPKGAKKATTPPRKAPTPAAARPAGQGGARGGREAVPSLQEAISEVKTASAAKLPSSAAAASAGRPPLASTTAVGAKPGGEGLDEAVARAREGFADRKIDDGGWDDDGRNVPTGGSLDTLADDFGEKGKSYTLKTDGVDDDGTRFVREGAREWDDGMGEEEGSDDVQIA